jgi:hypothetical protein
MAATSEAQTTRRAPADGSAAVAPVDGEALVHLMRARYSGIWYKTLTFVQKTTAYDAQGVPSVSTWYETSAEPGLLRIDQGNPVDGNGVLYTADSLFRMRAGKMVGASAGGNPVTTLVFDVYLDAPERSIARLKAAGFDLSKIHSDVWDKNAVWVVGAAAGDSVSPQFWVDKTRLMLVRQLSPARPGSARMLDARVGDFRPAARGWVGARFEFWIGGKLVQAEEYTDIHAEVPVDRELFDVTKWTTARHWARP